MTVLKELHIDPAGTGCWTGRVLSDGVLVATISKRAAADDVKRAAEKDHKISHVFASFAGVPLDTYDKTPFDRQEFALAVNTTAALMDGSQMSPAARARVVAAIYTLLRSGESSLLSQLRRGEIPGIVGDDF